VNGVLNSFPEQLKKFQTCHVQNGDGAASRSSISATSSAPVMLLRVECLRISRHHTNHVERSLDMHASVADQSN
jgi:hypothetical protein